MSCKQCIKKDLVIDQLRQDLRKEIGNRNAYKLRLEIETGDDWTLKNNYKNKLD